MTIGIQDLVKNPQGSFDYVLSIYGQFPYMKSLYIVTVIYGHLHHQSLDIQFNAECVWVDCEQYHHSGGSSAIGWEECT